MRFIFILMTIFLINSVSAKINKYAPSNFSCESSMCNYVDFEKGNYKITYNFKTKQVHVLSTIDFTMGSDGKAIFDLVPEIINNKVNVDGKNYLVKKINDPDHISSLRVIDAKLSKGQHQMVLSHLIDRGYRFEATGVFSAFWMTDLSDRGYLERYLPTNGEFDQYKIDFEIEIKNFSGESDLYTNGKVKNISKNIWKISFPKFYTCSSLFFHITPKGVHKSIHFEFSSVSGRIVPVTIYARRPSTLASYKATALRVLKEYERDLAPWPHQKVLIYGAGGGGMEYSGATMSSLRALGHELNHSYFARGIMPSGGNSGWIDEAIASWRDDGSKRSRSTRVSRSKLGGHSQYRRTTDRGAYSNGARFMETLDLILKNKGGLIAFLSNLAEHKMYQSINTKEFQKLLEQFYGSSLQSIFDKAIYSPKFKKMSFENTKLSNPYHKTLTQAELDQLL